MRVREGTPDDFVAAMEVIEGALLEVDADEVRAALAGGGGSSAPEEKTDGEGTPDGDRSANGARSAGGDAGGGGTVLLAETDRGRVIGAAVLAPVVDGADGETARVEAIAVRRPRRGTGVGRALIEAARDRADRLTAEFDPRVRGFYEALGFDIERCGERLRGRIGGR